MNTIELLNTKLTELQEIVLCELDKTTNTQFICKKLNIKPITLSKTISTLVDKELIKDNQISEKGKKMVHYFTFRNNTISSFLNKHQIPISDDLQKQLKSLDMKIIIALKNELI